MNTRDLFLSLLQSAIGERDVSVEAKESLNSGSIATLFKVSRAHDMAHLVAYAAEKAGVSLTGEVGELFEKEKKTAVLRYEMMKADMAEIFDCFDKESIEYIPLKGAVLRQYYPEPWMRTSCDIDILVREEDLERSTRALVEKCGYVTDNKKTYHDVSLFSPFGMHIELHHNIKEDTDKYDRVLTRVWEYSKKENEKSYMLLQSPEFLMVHLMCHMAYHFVGGGCGVRSVLDIWLLGKSISFDKELLDSLLKEAGLTKFYCSIKSLAEYWFGSLTEVDKTVLEIERFILLGGVYGTKKQGAAAKQVKKGGKLKYFWSRIFMPYRSLVILYPVIKKHKILTPFCQIHRWFSVIFKGKRIAKEIKNVSGVTQEQADRTERLLNDLEI